MSLKAINENPKALRAYIDRKKAMEEEYRKENPDSLIPCFEKELRELGFEFEITNQTHQFIPKHKKIILPLAEKYYELAKKQKKWNEVGHFLTFFAFKGNHDMVPLLLEDYYCSDTPDLIRWFISDAFYMIHSRRFIKEYLEIVSDKRFGINRQMIVLLLGKLKEESAIPTLVELLEDEEVRLQAIDSLGKFKREEFRCYFERFQESKHPGWRKYARLALKKLDANKTGDSSVS